MANLSPVEKAKLKKIFSDPVLWAKCFLISNDAVTRKKGPWVARDYQKEMLRDRSIRKVYRCARRLGKSEVMVVDALWMAFTREHFRVIFVTPYESQVNLIFMRIREFIHESPLVKNEVTRMINSPYAIEFKNKSSIMGFTTGASSGSGAASIKRKIRC